MVTTAVNTPTSSADPKNVAHACEPDGRYRIDHYDLGPAFSSFLPGIGGSLGVPLWCFYVNRAQAVISFGVRDKDHAIAEFLPANWAYQLVATQGFRTFCEIDHVQFEPFHPGHSAAPHVTRRMWIELDRLIIQEQNHRHDLEITVQYLSPVNRPLAALLRSVSIRNLATTPRRLRLLDGLPVFVPAGFSDEGLKRRRHISEAYAQVRLVDATIAYAASKVAMHDEAEVCAVRHGHFFAAWCSDDGELRPLAPLVDPDVIFGGGNDLLEPRRYFQRAKSAHADQILENRIPCAFAPVHAVLEPEQAINVWELFGHADAEEPAAAYVARFKTPHDFDRAADESRAVLRSVSDPAFMCSSAPLLDAYARQNYVDNVLRGGVPVILPSTSGPTPLHVYARRHGDLERDYNEFVLTPTPLSTGPGNYRDICQNRRCDLWLYPDVADLEIRSFVEPLQADGYNPLAIAGYHWSLRTGTDPDESCPSDEPSAREAFRRITAKPFLPGDLLAWAQAFHIEASVQDGWLHALLGACDRRLIAAGHDGGYWIDHWTYITDLLESYAAIYPDRVESMLHDGPRVGWWDEGARIAPQREKYVTRGGRAQQLNAVTTTTPRRQPLPEVSIYAKLCALVAIKTVSFDPTGRGIEMEAGRPGWNDAMNGLPALFGSSLCETAELARLARWLRTVTPGGRDAALPQCVAELLHAVVADLSLPDYDWHRSVAVREQFRARLYEDRGEPLQVVSAPQIDALLDGAEMRARRAIEQSIDQTTGLLHTYYSHELSPTKRDTCLEGDFGLAERKFTPHPLPLYLEGQVHWLKLATGPRDAGPIHKAVRSSPLFDTTLRMYKLNECVDRCSPRIGRARSFTRGWFENESIWLHMSYKYLLELLRSGLSAEFFDDARTMLTPFMDPLVYGRSVLENSSFLGSSANPDPATHGRGFIARLSGSSAEFISIWLWLTTGGRPFQLTADGLTFALRPVLPGSWFSDTPRTTEFRGEPIEIPTGGFACALLGTILLVYHNDQRRDTFGDDGVRPLRYVIDGEREIFGPQVGGALVEEIRSRRVRRIDVWLGDTARAARPASIDG